MSEPSAHVQTLRLGLVAYSIYHDARSAIKYTDIDYQVFTDAARELYTAQTPATGSYAPRLVGDPFARDTYRYTPLLAVLMLPNITLHPAFGKLLFSLADLGVGWLLLAYLRRRGLSPRVRLGWAGGLWLLNPWVAAISTRGSSEALLGLLVVASLERAEAGRWNASAIWLGLAAHFKLYPVIYGAAILARLWRRPVLAVRYSLLAATTFTLANAAMYAIWGWPFLDQAFVYHARRLDLRHNFSPYFYPIYLSSVGQASSLWRHPLLSFGPQLMLSLGLGFIYGRDDLAFAWFVQTFAFVTFNKVCTSQYFLWYIWFLPLVLPFLHFPRVEAIALPAVWIGGQAIWLSYGYRLEFVGEAVFRELWLASVGFFVGNVVILTRVLIARQRSKGRRKTA